MLKTTRPLVFFIVGLLLTCSAAMANAGSSVVTVIPELIGDHELAGYFAVGPGCGQALTENTRDGFKGLLDCFEGEIFLRFDNPLALLASSLEITAELVSPDDTDLISRLPSTSVLIPADFPVLIKIRDDANDGFTFADQWELEIETRELEFSDRSPLRLFRAAEGCAEPGCPFEDATFSSGFGSYHVRGSFGTFSDFIIAADMRPDRAIVADKISKLSQQVDDFEQSGDIDPAVAEQLQTELTNAGQAVLQSDFETAFFSMINFIILVDTNAGTGISDDWDPDEGLVSVVGILFGGADTVIFSLETAARPQAISTGGDKRKLFTDSSSLEVTILFDETTDLQTDGFYIDAFDIDPFDPTLLDRLPANVGIDPAFPVLLVIGADASNRPAARGDWEVSVKTRDVKFRQGSNFRLFKAVNSGGTFIDTTDQLGSGSLVARGAVAEFDQFAFSEYLLVRDDRATGAVVTRKFTLLQTLLAGMTIDAALAEQLTSELQAAKNAADGGSPSTAVDLLDVFIATVETNAGILIPDIWRADDERRNDAGRLTSKAKSLQFSLSIEDAPLEADPADVNRDGTVDAADVFAAIQAVYCPTGCESNLLPAPPKQ